MRAKFATGVCAAIAALATPTLMGPAFAQDATGPDPYAAVQFDAGGRVILVGGGFDGDSAEAIAMRLDLEAGVETVLDSGLALGARVAVAGERDHPARTPRGGLAGTCPAGVADCATVASAAVRAPVSGYAGADIRDGRGRPRGAVEEAYVYIDGGWGAVNLGLTEGAAAALSLPTPSILAGSSTVDGHLNLTGLGGAQTINDFSGASTKIAFESVSLLGLSAGLSFTPETDHRTLDQGYARRAGEAVSFEGENIWEAGLRFERVWASGLETRAALTYLTAESAVSAVQWDTLNAWSAGVQLGLGPVRGGVSVLESDNGWAAGDRHYRSYAASGIYEVGPWSLMLEGSSADDNLAHVQIDSVLAGVGRDIGDGAAISLSLLHQNRSVPDADSLGRRQREETSQGLFLEFAADL